MIVSCLRDDYSTIKHILALFINNIGVPMRFLYLVEYQYGDGYDKSKSVSSNYCEVYSIQQYVIKVVSDLRQVGSFLRVLRFPAPIKLTVNTIDHCYLEIG